MYTYAHFASPFVYPQPNSNNLQKTTQKKNRTTAKEQKVAKLFLSEDIIQISRALRYSTLIFHLYFMSEKHCSQSTSWLLNWTYFIALWVQLRIHHLALKYSTCQQQLQWNRVIYQDSSDVYVHASAMIRIFLSANYFFLPFLHSQCFETLFEKKCSQTTKNTLVLIMTPQFRHDLHTTVN